MRILLTGGTGLIGQALCRHWTTIGHQMVVVSRKPEQVPWVCGPTVRGIYRLSELGEGADSTFDAVVNLAGAPIADRPWTDKRMALLLTSRVALTDELVGWMKERAAPPKVLISSSAVGWYGDGGDRELSEAGAPNGNDFASQLCGAWEQSALAAEGADIRVVLVRTGLVLARDGGFLKRLLLPFKLGLGGPIGNGKQWMPWIHLHDQVALIDFLLNQPNARGPYNACAPTPKRNADFARSLAASLHRPACLAVPGVLLRLGLGELSGLLLGGQRALPVRLLAAGFSFRFTDLDAALQDLLGPAGAKIRG